MGYEFWLSPEATRALLGTERRQREKMETVLQRLAETPFREPDFREKSPAGRIYDVKCFDDVIVTYWLDHATKEVRIIRLETA
ncbi:MAG TPA: hypothetical protein VIM71_11970 [Lacunisphaera sp.]